MNCDRVRDLLPLDVYGDLDASETDELQEHLKDCPECNKVRAALAETRHSLDMLPTPDVRVNTARITRAASERQLRSHRRWKRGALAMGALAAGLLLVLLVRPEVRVADGQFVIRWSDTPTPMPAPKPESVVVVKSVARDADIENRIRILSDLVLALREDVETGDRDRRHQLDMLTTRLDLLRLQAQQRYDETRQDVTALYQAQFGKSDQ